MRVIGFITEPRVITRILDHLRTRTSVAMKSEPLSEPVETFTTDLQEVSGGGELGLSWGAMKLSSSFTFGQ